MTKQAQEKPVQGPELRGVWFSFYDWDTLPDQPEAFRAAAEQVAQNVADLGLNTIFLHVHSHSDSYYLKSSYFPYSKRAPAPLAPSGTEREALDPLSVFIEAAHKRGLELHAWFNPYRIGSAAQLESAPADSCIGKWRRDYEQRLSEADGETEEQAEDREQALSGTETPATPESPLPEAAFTEVDLPDGEELVVLELDSEGNPVPAAEEEPVESEEKPYIPCPIINHNGVFYLNPSSAEIQQTLVAAIREVCENYEIDGVHFDDYFYPVINDKDPALSFDKIDWEKSGSEKTITQWRRDNVSSLIEAIHTAVHEYNLPYGISPAGNIDNLIVPNHYLIDLDLWLSSDRYIDYIMPQIYWGFEPRAANGNLRPWAFENCLKSWKTQLKHSPVTLYVGLALYKGGTDNRDGNEISEWLRYDDIIARQILLTRDDPLAQGFVLYTYKDILAPLRQAEVSHIRDLLK